MEHLRSKIDSKPTFNEQEIMTSLSNSILTGWPRGEYKAPGIELGPIECLSEKGQKRKASVALHSSRIHAVRTVMSRCGFSEEFQPLAEVTVEHDEQGPRFDITLFDESEPEQSRVRIVAEDKKDAGPTDVVVDRHSWHAMLYNIDKNARHWREAEMVPPK